MSGRVDDKLIVVMTHGDELNDSDRIRAHIFLGQLLGVSAVDQVYDISGKTVGRKDICLLKFVVACKGKWCSCICNHFL